jgi:reductive dehalogenase
VTIAEFLRIRQPEHRPFHWGPYPLEELPRDPAIRDIEATRPALATPPAEPASSKPFAETALRYLGYFQAFRDGEPAPAKAPVPDDLAERAKALKGTAYFMDASHVGICSIPENAWILGTSKAAHSHAVAILVEYGRRPDSGNLARDWVAGTEASVFLQRAAEIAACVAGELRAMGIPARAHWAGATGVDLDRLAVLAGVAVRDDEDIVSPFVGRDFALAVVTADYELPEDAPLAAGAAESGTGIRYRFGLSGAVSGLERARREKRASHLSQYPMEQVKRVDRPTTLILDEEVPRVPKRALFFRRAGHGDLGPKAQREVKRFAVKHPLAAAFIGPIMRLVPHQGGDPSNGDPSRYTDPAANTRAIKALSYFLGSDLTGICEVPNYAWYSHRDDGSEVIPYHRYAVVMLIDQGFDTMEGASGDDWISGVQSMRAYLRGAEIAGMMADFLRGLGFSSRSHTNADSDVLHIPLVLWAGLGELSRIGELVLNPFVGPRFKSVVFTTDMPLEVDKPIDFKLQYFCSNCQKCARECPCDAIPYGDKVMFNGYEIWKPDVERCTSYRLTNAGGAACGRCMKTCPLNKVVNRDGPILTRIASWCGVNAMWLKPFLVPIAVKLDDVLGHGRINKIKKWWLDLEMKDGIAVTPKRVNRREIEPEKKTDPAKQKMAHYPASVMPPPVTDGPFPTDRKAALEEKMETVAEARRRHAAGGKPPASYSPPPPQTGAQTPK